MSDPLVSRMQPHAETIFATMSALALEHDAINLGQGFPDTDGPAEVLEAAREAIDAGHNQYPPTAGIPALREAIAAHQARHHSLRPDPADEVLVTSGATEAIAAAVLGLVTPGDEVVVIEPSYDSYAAVIALAGGVRRTVPLRFPDLSLDPQELAAAFSDRTRVVVVNSPHHPTGKVFTPDELALVRLVGEARQRIYADGAALEAAVRPLVADRGAGAAEGRAQAQAGVRRRSGAGDE